MEKIIISPPFSNLYISSMYPKVTRIVGTYTLHKRSGFWKALSTLNKTNRGWVNNLGLRNRGVQTAPDNPVIISISGLHGGEWVEMLNILAEREHILGVELNISCPNAKVLSIDPQVLGLANSLFECVIVKTPHGLESNKTFELVEMGAKALHVSNGKKVVGGSLSGLELIKDNLASIKSLRREYPRLKIIAGGGIYEMETILRYESAGADHFSLSTSLFNPIKTFKLIRDFNERSHRNV